MPSLYWRGPKKGSRKGGKRLPGDTAWMKWQESGEPVYESLHTKDPAYAKFLFNEKCNKLALGESPLRKKKTLAMDVLALYEEYITHRNTKKSVQNSISRIRRFVQFSGAQTIGALRPDHLSDYLSQLFREENISKHTANRLITNIKTWMVYARKNGYVHENAFASFEKYRLPQNPPSFYTTEEIEKLLAVMRDDVEMHNITAAGFYCGARIGELLHFDNDSVDLKKDLINILNKDGFTTKSKKFRHIPLHSGLKTLLAATFKRKGFLFYPDESRDNNKLYKRINKLFQDYVGKAELRPETFHVTRRSFASNLVMRGVSIFKVSKWLGHASVKTTEESYAYLAPQNDEEINVF